MASRRIDGERLDGVLDRLGQRAARTATDVERSGVETSGVKPSSPDMALVIEAVAGWSRSSPTARSPHQDLIDFVMPRITDATVLQGGRAAAILEHLVSDILPHLADGDELRVLASAVITDEIARHRDLLTRLHAGIAA